MSELWRSGAHPEAIIGSTLRARLPQVAVGEVCEIRAGVADTRVLALGVVTLLDAGMASIGLLGPAEGLSSRAVVMPTGRHHTVAVSSDMLGSVLDGLGHCVDRLTERDWTPGDTRRALTGPAPDYRQRQPIDTALCTGIRVVDGLLSVGLGQRTGIFAGAGAGKTTFSDMLLHYTQADVVVIALIGERGREVAHCVERVRSSTQAGRTVIVQATSDTAPAIRCNAALLATSVAEYFRDAGHDVLLVMDSLTRYARALRDVALSSGQMPARGGYPASVMEALPRLLERPGRTRAGSITAFYTVLLEDEEMPDPVGEEVKSLLDGHIYLSSRLAGRGHYPAVDVLRSRSRLFEQLVSPQHRQQAQKVRQTLGVLQDLQVLRELGEYKPGQHAVYDAAVALERPLDAFLQQDAAVPSIWEYTQRGLHALAS